jgi:hypothetical protein
VVAPKETPSPTLSSPPPLQLSWPPSLLPGFPGRHHYYGATRFLSALRLRFSAPALYFAYLPERDRTSPAQDAIRPPRVMRLSVSPCCPHPRLIPPGLLRMPLPPVLAESGLQGVAPTGSPGFDSLGCGLVVCLRSFRFRLATDTLPFSATVRIQLDRQVFHLRENSTAGHTSTSAAGRTGTSGRDARPDPGDRAPAAASGPTVPSDGVSTATRLAGCDTRTRAGNRLRPDHS